MSEARSVPMAARTEDVAVVMDLGGTRMRVAVADRAGAILWREAEPTRAQESQAEVIAQMEAILDRGIAQVGDRTLAGIGIGLAGPVDPVTGIMYDPPNIRCLDGVSVKDLWEKRFNRPILVCNDATVAALGEYRYGVGVGARTLVYMTVSTGIGGGIVVEGQPLMGAYGMAGELGHMCVDLNGPTCQCGNSGCLERIASGTAIAETARRRLEGAASSVMGGLVSGELGRITAQTVFQAASQGDPLARDILDHVARALGCGLVNVLHIFNPDVIVLGGGVSRDWEQLRPGVEAYIEAKAMSHIRKRGFKIAVSSLGDDIGLLGAAALVWQSS